MPGRKKITCEYKDCKKRINVVEIMMATCKCNKHFCNLHRLPEQHDCKYNYKNIDLDAEINKLKCVSDRIERV